MAISQNFDTKILKKDISLFTANFREMGMTEAGKELFSNAANFALNISGITVANPAMAPTSLAIAAQHTLQLIRLLPESLLSAPDSPIINQQKFLQVATPEMLESSLMTVFVGTQAMIAGGMYDLTNIDYILQAAFGQDKPSKEIQKKIINDIKPIGPLPKIPIGMQNNLHKLEGIVRAGRTREWLQRGMKCVGVSAMRRHWPGKIRSILMDTPCAGSKMQIFIDNFSFEPGLQLCLPIIGGRHVYLNLEEQISNQKITKNDIWGATILILNLPDDISSGNVFFNIPDNRDPDCIDFWSVMSPLPQGFPIKAGKPVIRFAATHTQKGYAQQYIDLAWEVENVETINIKTVALPDSSSPHQLPAVSIPAGQFKGTLRVSVSCTRRWKGQYVLYAGNACGMAEPVAVELDNRYTDFLIGTGIADVTDDTVMGLGMMGFSDELQKTTGVDSRLYARAFVLAKNVNTPTKERTAIVVADIMSCTQAVKTEVAKRLQATPELNNLYTAENVLICGTHTHGAPGGYSHYFLYNLTGGGFDEITFNVIVNGIVQSIVKANRNLAPGRIYVNKGEIENCGFNRSKEAYLNNADALEFPARDKEMLLLKFVKDNNGAPRDVGILNWYALHPTNMSQYNTLITGDNKGWASFLFETSKGVSNRNVADIFVAGFANSCTGDVSGNNQIPDGSSRDIKNMKALGDKQFQAAKALADTATEELTGGIEFRYKHLPISNISIDNMVGKRTWPAAFGVSFGAGSTEDSVATVLLGGLAIPSPIREGVTDKDLIFSDIIGGTTLAALTPIPGAILIVGAAITAAATGVGISEAARSVMGIIPMAKRSGLLDKLLYLVPLRILVSVAFIALVEEKLNKNPLPPPLQIPDDGQPVPEGWKLPIPSPIDIAGHSPKPIMFPAGNAQPFPLVPSVVPIQLLKIGKFVIAGVPAEFNTMPGRRLKRTLQDVFGTSVKDIAITNYANAYSSYVATEEEYKTQSYEGASTLYGPHTLAAYQQEFEKLAKAMISGQPIDSGSPEEVRFVSLKHRGIPQTNVYIKNQTNKDANIRIFHTQDETVSYNWPLENVSAYQNLLIAVPAEAFNVSINGQPSVPHKGGDIIII